jgi:hypothetical protein
MPQMSSEEQAKPWGWGDFVIFIVLVALFVLGGYLLYKTDVAIGGIRGWLAMVGRWFVQLALVMATFAVYVACFAVLHVVISLATGTRLRRVKIFISFKHDYESIATEIQNGLEGPDIEVLRLPFRSQRDHDDVIAESFVVVPGPEPSWMANELGLAVGSKKPIAVIKHLPDQHLSDSLYRGYPVFAWEKLRTCNLIPLRRFMAFSAKSRGDIRPQFFRTVAGFGKMVAAGLTAWWVISVVVKEVDRILFAFAPRKAEAVAVSWLWAILILLAAVFAIGFAQAFVRRARGLAVARQKIRTREATYSEFSAVFSLLEADATILEVLEKAPLEPGHNDRTR